MKTLSSLELHYMVKELKTLEGSRVDSIYHQGKEAFLFQLFKSGEGKKLVQVILGKCLYLTSLKEDMEATSGFCLLLRKHLENTFLGSFSQVEPERIVKCTFSSKEETFDLFIEFFGKGNILLCKDGIIIDALHHQEFKDRTIAPKEKYAYPAMPYNLFSLDKAFLQSMLSSTTKDSLVKSLAIELGLGGIFSEEACLQAGLDKNAKPADLTSEECAQLLTSLQQLLNHSIEALIYLQEGELEGVYPFALKTMEMHEHRSFESFSTAVEYYAEHATLKVRSSVDARLAEIKRIIEQQEKNIVSLEEEEKEQRQRAEVLYSNYVQLDTLLKELHHISKKHSWQEIKEKLKGHTLIKDVNPKDKSIVIELP